MRFSETPIGPPNGSWDLSRFCLTFWGRFRIRTSGCFYPNIALFAGVSVQTVLKGISAKVEPETSASGRKWCFTDIYSAQIRALSSLRLSD